MLYDILIWEEETQKYSCIAGPFKTLEETKKTQKQWWKDYDDISIIIKDIGTRNATLKNVYKHNQKQ